MMKAFQIRWSKNFPLFCSSASDFWKCNKTGNNKLWLTLLFSIFIIQGRARRAAVSWTHNFRFSTPSTLKDDSDIIAAMRCSRDASHYVICVKNDSFGPEERTSLKFNRIGTRSNNLLFLRGILIINQSVKEHFAKNNRAYAKPHSSLIWLTLGYVD